MSQMLTCSLAAKSLVAKLTERVLSVTSSLSPQLVMTFRRQLEPGKRISCG